MIPAGLRIPSTTYIDYTFSPSDFFNNILLFIPLGIALGGSSLLWAFLFGFGLSTTAEVLQLGFIDRIPSPFDIASNTLGALAGHLLAAAWFRVTGHVPIAIRIPKSGARLGIPAALAGVFLLVHHQTKSDLSNWSPAFDFAIGHELNGERHWNGSVSKVELIPFAVHRSAIATSELAQDAGSPQPVRLVPASLTNPTASAASAPIWDVQTLAGSTAANGSPLPGKQQEEGVYNALVRSNQFTLLVWMRTDSLEQAGPARIVTYSRDSMNRNFTLGQIHNTLTFRLRTPASGLNGTNPALFSGPVLSAHRNTFVAVVYDGRIVTMYVDGVHVAERDLGAKRPRLPGRLLAKLPRSRPLPEIELSLSEMFLSCLFTLGLLAVVVIPDRLPHRLLIGAGAGIAIGGAIWLFGVSAPSLGLSILSECVLSGLVVAASVSEPTPMRYRL
jgi:hypothetical protein